MTRTSNLAAALLALAAVPAAAAPAVRDFELPPGPAPAPTATPQVQGPVDPDAPVATRPRVVSPPAGRSTLPPVPAETASPQAAVRGEPSDQQPAQTARQSTQPPAEEPRTDMAAPAAASPDAAPPQTAVGPAIEDRPAGPVPDTLPRTPSASPTDPDHAVLPWGWLTAALVSLTGLAGALVWWRRRTSAPASVPQIELPLVTPADEKLPPSLPVPAAIAPQPAPRPAQHAALRIEATPSHLTRSLMAATFSCRISLINQGSAPLDDVVIAIDLTTAHGSVPSSEQLADLTCALPEVGRIAAIAPGKSVEFAHEVRLPTAAIRIMQQGSAQLYVPLLRVRAQAEGDTPVARTFIVGTLPEGGAKKLQPFRLDEMPQTYRAIGLAALD